MAEVMRDAMLAMGGLDLSALTSRLALEDEVPSLDATTFQHLTRSNQPGMPATALSLDAWYDGAAVDEAIFDALRQTESAAPSIFTASKPATAGGSARLIQARPGSKPVTARVGELWSLTITASGRERWARGVVLENDTKTVTGTGTGQVLFSTLATGETLVGNLHVLGGTFSSLDVTVESDDDAGFPSPVTRLTFPNIASSPAVSRVTLAGPITPDTQYRATWTLTGTDALIYLAIGIRP